MALGCMCTVAACRNHAVATVRGLELRSCVIVAQYAHPSHSSSSLLNSGKTTQTGTSRIAPLAATHAVDLHRRNESAPRNTSTGDAYIGLQLLRTDAHEAVKMVGVGRSSVTLRLLRDFAREMPNAFTRTHYLINT